MSKPVQNPSEGPARLHPFFVASLTTAMTVVALGFVTQSFRDAPLMLRLAAQTWIGIGGTAALVMQFTGARPRLGLLSPGNLGLALLAGTGLALVGTGTLHLEYRLIPWMRPFFDQKQAFFDQILGQGSSFGPLSILLVMALTPALCEEFLFRGVLRTYLARFVGVGARVLVLGFLFSLMHMDVTVLIPMTLIGALLGVAAERSGGWLIAALAHFALNAFNALLWPLVEDAAGLAHTSDLLDPLIMVAAGSAVATWSIGRLKPGLPTSSGTQEPPTEAPSADAPASDPI